MGATQTVGGRPGFALGGLQKGSAYAETRRGVFQVEGTAFAKALSWQRK